MTENEKKLIEQIYEKVCEMEERVTKLGDSVKGLKNETIEVHTGLQDTFTKGFADVHKGIKQINKNRKTAREIVEGIAGNEQKQRGKQVH